VKTAGSKQRYSFERQDIVFSKGGYHVLKTRFSSACSLTEKENIMKT
jgi:hypothetical protein